MIKESEYCCKVTGTKFNKSLVVSEKQHEDFNNSSKCYICKKLYEVTEVKVTNNYINGK